MVKTVPPYLQQIVETAFSQLKVETLKNSQIQNFSSLAAEVILLRLFKLVSQLDEHDVKSRIKNLLGEIGQPTLAWTLILFMTEMNIYEKSDILPLYLQQVEGR